MPGKVLGGKISSSLPTIRKAKTTEEKVILDRLRFLDFVAHILPTARNSAMFSPTGRISFLSCAHLEGGVYNGEESERRWAADGR